MRERKKKKNEGTEKERKTDGERKEKRIKKMKRNR